WTIDGEFVVGEENIERYVDCRHLPHQLVAYTLTSQSPLQRRKWQSTAACVLRIGRSRAPCQNFAIEYERLWTLLEHWNQFRKGFADFILRAGEDTHTSFSAVHLGANAIVLVFD